MLYIGYPVLAIWRAIQHVVRRGSWIGCGGLAIGNFGVVGFLVTRSVVGESGGLRRDRTLLRIKTSDWYAVLKKMARYRLTLCSLVAMLKYPMGLNVDHDRLWDGLPRISRSLAVRTFTVTSR